MTQILLVDDHPLVRRGIIQVIVGEFPDSVVSEASNETEAMEAVYRQSWSLVLLDLSLPGRGGVELLKEIQEARPNLPVLIVTSHPESQFATRVLRAGAAGYFTKDKPPEMLVAAVRHILAGGKYISPTLAERLVSEMKCNPSRPLHELLSDREYDVMLRISRGQATSKVAEILNLSVKTISTYRMRILEKMRLESNVDLTQYAIRNKLIE